MTEEQKYNYRIEVSMVDRTAEKTIRDFLIGLRIFAAVKDGVAPYCWKGCLTPWLVREELKDVYAEDGGDAIRLPFEAVTDIQILIAYRMCLRPDFLATDDIGPYEVIDELESL